MCDLGLEVRGQVDNVDGIEGAFLGADTATNTQALRDEGDFRRGLDFDAQFAGAHDRAGLFALLATFLGFALVRVDNGNTSELVRHGGGDSGRGCWLHSALQNNRTAKCGGGFCEQSARPWDLDEQSTEAGARCQMEGA